MTGGTLSSRGSFHVRTFLVIGGLVLGAVIGEVALRVAGFSYVLYPERIEFGAPDPQQLASGFLEDKDLFWVPNDYLSHTLSAAEASHPSMVFMGDSCTQWGSYPVLLHREVRQNFTAANPIFLNFGVAGYSSHQGLRQLERDVLPLKPRVVTLLYGWNDHWKGFGITDGGVSRMLSDSLLFRFQQESRLCQLAVKALMALRILRAEKVPMRVSPGEFNANLTKMVKLSIRSGTIPVLLTAPTSHIRGREPEYLAERHIDDLSDLVPLHREYLKVVRQVAETESVLLCDLADLFEKISPPEARAAYFKDDGIHLLPAGDAMIAGHLYECFGRADLLRHILN